MREDYMDYAMSVIVGRALPDVRDGLKPVHRRVLFAMHELGLQHNKQYRKCARIVGDVLGKYHPHGDLAVYDTLVRMAQWFSLRYMLVDGQGNFGCFTKDTKVRLADGRCLSFEELIKEDKAGKKNYTFTVNPAGVVEIAQIKNPRMTKKSQAVMKVVFDNGEEVRCTLDHRFMLRDGIYTEARLLKSGDSMMPVYMRLSSEKDALKPELLGYEMVYQPKTGEWVPCHVLADEWNLRNGVYGKSAGRVRHHVDFNNDEERLAQTLSGRGKLNHKIARIEFLNEREDVYDLTIEGSHNFALASGVFVHNSIDGDSAAAMRYTEARFAKIADEMLRDIEMDTVGFIPNFDGSMNEPIILPNRIPNLLINGSSGIAVGMSTNIPPHNISEICDAIVMLIDRPDAGLEDLVTVVKGPDFPTGGMICGRSGILEAYKTGRGSLRVRGMIEAEEEDRLVITEIPYMVNKSNLIESMANLVKDKRIEGIRDIRDESGKDGIRVVIELSRDASPEIVINKLYQHTQLQTTFGIINLALVDNLPRILPLKDMLCAFILHRKDIVVRRTKFLLAKAQDRVHILLGLKIALDNIDAVVELIKRSRDPAAAKAGLMSKFGLSEKQAEAILQMRLQTLTGLEREKIDDEHARLMKEIEGYEKILSSEKEVLAVIRAETVEIREKYGDERKTRISDEVTDVCDEDLIPREDFVVTLTNKGYVKKVPVGEYRTQKRGGVGITAAGIGEDGFVKSLILANSHDNLLFFTNRGRVHWLRTFQLPSGSRYSMGKAIVNYLQLEQGEKVSTTVPLKGFETGRYLMFATGKGTVKKTGMEAYSRPRKGGIIAVTLKEGDELIDVKVTSGERNIFLATRNGYAIRFSEKDVRGTGRSASGVMGIRLRKADGVIGMEVLGESEAEKILTVSVKGYGKRTDASFFKVQRRGGKGLTNMKVTGKTGKVMAVKKVSGGENIMLISSQGTAIMVQADSISLIGRATQGVRVMKLRENDTLEDMELVEGNGEEAENAEEAASEGAKESEEVRKDGKEKVTGDGAAGDGESDAQEDENEESGVDESAGKDVEEAAGPQDAPSEENL
ncbi:MAG: DNA gyrase subunit A [Candidatus Aenigmatarchaeota archaeon]